MIRSILVVCIGNTCRSPMAQCLLGNSLPGCTITSAGLAPLEGAAADPHIVRLLAEDGLDLPGHRARVLDASMVSGADLVLVMDTEQREALERLYPHARGKVYRLCEFVHADVPDPYGCSQNMFRIVFGLIKQGVDTWVVRIRAIARDAYHGEVA
ncbi:low molecular weight phosphotyrosine protein phosphatase [Cupriavidus sp. 2TAF22]|uniref:arsenate reductase/protein-tyrosine-phosphatase family protein n=1 Tax=unclassified Cupriavidus TaxID=2640874 RepID=UPI003F8E4C4F